MGIYSYKIIAMLIDGQEVSCKLDTDKEIEEVCELNRKQLAEGALSIVGETNSVIFPTDRIINLEIINITEEE
ncbi:hypothetical protein [Vagococcus salmoninarum]|uniref:hypothetical protein n=1 Tax=Vagococcus salmoninarum TaxID=2739 RepID=UPI00187E9D71|nr:hypothetical protein [Vagococcus salmoninarum]MBE9390151.1 hypothetical protein [Vagococcus salmoninarum]